jgi:NAD(P)H dehydrogenase (quinone)
MTRALVVYCHPLEGSFVASLRDRTVAALQAAGAEVRLTDLYADDFHPALTAADRARHASTDVAADLERHAVDLRWCDVLVLVYPTWWAGQPAMLKGWIDRVWTGGIAFTIPPGSSRLRPALRNIRRLVVVTTHGSPKYVNAIEGEGGKRTVTRSLRAMCSRRARTTWLAMYGVDTASAAARERFADRVDRRLRRVAGSSGRHPRRT